MSTETESRSRLLESAKSRHIFTGFFVKNRVFLLFVTSTIKLSRCHLVYDEA